MRAQPLVQTIRERCRICFTCVRECPAKAIRVAEGQAEVVPERCIGCGNCIRVCSQEAKAVARSSTYFRATRLAPKATSWTYANPMARSMPASPSGVQSVNSAGKLGATQAATGPPEARRPSTAPTELATRLAPWLQTRTQLPHPMHRSGMTSACQPAMRMALAGHSRTQV